MKKGIDILQEVLQEALEEKRRKQAMNQTQYCPKCKTDKLADTKHFYNDSKSKTGLSCWCKLCQRKAMEDRNKKKLAVNKTKPEPAKIKKKPVTSRSHAKKKMTLTLDFSEYDLWYQDLLSEADDKLRTPEKQAIWLITESLYKERSQINERN